MPSSELYKPSNIQYKPYGSGAGSSSPIIDDTVQAGVAGLKPVSVLSSANGSKIIDQNYADHSKDMAAISPNAQDYYTKERFPDLNKETKPTGSVDKSLKDQGGYTVDEVNASGLDTTNYKYDPSTKYFLPKTATQTDGVNKQYEADLSELDQAFAPLQKNLDASHANLLKSVTDIYAQMKNEAEQVTASDVRAATSIGLRLGGKYAPGGLNGLVSNAQKAGLERLKTIGLKETSVLAEAEQSYQDNNYKMFVEKRNELKDLRKDKQAELTKIQERAIADQKEFRLERQKREEKFTSDLNGILTDAGKNNAPPEVIDAIRNSKDVASAVKAAGEYLQSGSGIVGEYTAYKRDAVTRGLTPLSFDEYQTRDANRKLKQAAALNSAGLNQTQMNTALKLSDDYEQRSKDFYTQRDSYNRVLASASDPSAAGDLALIFNYMKTLDPNSTVREGEFATAQNSGSAWDVIGAKYNKVKSGERLTQTQRDDFVKRATTLFNSSKKQQEATIKTFTDRAVKYGVPADLVVRDAESTSNAGQDIVKEQQGAKSTVDGYVSSNPAEAETIANLSANNYTDEDIVEYLKLNKKI